MSGWQRPIITDSGGFQAYSLIRQNAKFGNMNSKGINFQPEGASRKFLLTPEKSIQLQLAYEADVVICLDDCTHVDASNEEQELSVKRTIAWAKRCRETFDKLVSEKKMNASDRPLLFGVIQGGGIFELRKHCADELLKIGFDGYGYGGWQAAYRYPHLHEKSHSRAISNARPRNRSPVQRPGLLPTGLWNIRLCHAYPRCPSRTSVSILQKRD